MSSAKIQQEVEKYLKRMRTVRGGRPTPESSYYSAPENLINNISDAMNFNLVCNAQSSGDGQFPDFGLFSQSRLSAGDMGGSMPEFGVMEMKGLSADVREVAKGDQAAGYLSTHGIVAISNYREFLLLGKDNEGNPQEREFISLAKSEEEFWNLTSRPSVAAADYAGQLSDFIRQIPLETTTLSESEDIAWLLARHAENALKRLGRANRDDLRLLRETLEQSLNVSFKEKEQERLFRSTLVQTMFYGLFSAWIRSDGDKNFNWKAAKENIPVPVIQELFEYLTLTSNRRQLELDIALENAAGALNRIDREAFFDKFKRDDAIQNFYEMFLAKFDPETRKEKGVWYTPREVVRYMVERVDVTLRKELGYENGLADKNVYVLDPCCGTGVYLIEVLRKIKEINDNKKLGKAVSFALVKKAAETRIFGFEIMAAPLVIAHYQIEDFLDEISPPPSAHAQQEPWKI